MQASGWGEEAVRGLSQRDREGVGRGEVTGGCRKGAGRGEDTGGWRKGAGSMPSATCTFKPSSAPSSLQTRAHMSGREAAKEGLRGLGS